MPLYCLRSGSGWQFAPGNALLALTDDYARMVEDAWLLDDAESFDALIDACSAIEDRANGRG